MNELHHQIARARRRLLFEQFLARSVWCLFAVLAVAAIAIAVPRVDFLWRLVSIHALPANYDLFCFAAAIAWSRRRRHLDVDFTPYRSTPPSKSTAASTSANASPVASLSPTTSNEPKPARPSIRDAQRAASRIDVGDKFRLRFSSHSCYP